MNSTLVKVYDPECLIYTSQDKIKILARDDFKPYTVKCEMHKISVLENQNLTLFSLLYDNCTFEIDGLIITLYSKKEEKDKVKNKILEIKCADDQQLKAIKQQMNNRQVFSSYRGPLSFLPIRQERTSLLSSESPEQNYRGFLNLMIMILVANHIRLIMENFLKYGFLLQNILSFQIKIHPPHDNPQLLALIVLAFNCFIAYLIQYYQFSNKPKGNIVLIMNTINVMLAFILPCYVIQGTHPTLNLILLGIQLVIVMKLISYSHVMRNAKFYVERIKQVQHKKQPLSSFFNGNEVTPDNLQILQKHANDPIKLVDYKHFIYFLAAPTLCFQFMYPRSPSIRKLWVLKRLAEFLMVTTFQIIIWFQYVEPLLNNTYIMLKEDSTMVRLFDRLLKLSLPNTYLWIAAFFGGFQCWLNILSELLRFADRQFYKDWWNCKNLEEYWKLWNLPVHHWLLRHVYFPLLKRGVSKTAANMLVFLISAIGHEYVVSASLGTIGIWAFIGMMSQAPVIQFQKYFEKTFKLQDSQIGNVMFWCSFCIIGQPLLIFIYYFRYLELYNVIIQ